MNTYRFYCTESFDQEENNVGYVEKMMKIEKNEKQIQFFKVIVS